MNKKCAIYNRYSINDKEKLEYNKNILIKYCKEKLNIDDFVVFEEVAPVHGVKKQFDEIMDRIQKGEFTDLLIYSVDRIENKSPEVAGKIFGNIYKYNVEIHCMKNGKAIIKYARLFENGNTSEALKVFDGVNEI